ncbi:maltose/moltooligosaccharide transporter [Geodermatophilus saharensis]|uniref:Maltose/moltooligosaccharide transporter n=2 Tax=Geodermatophilus saharensis TaxID=1137994 RepID=A0A239DLA6_9ACTN|nr:maltose/moltooligosaccharide transporter [Geodermatophilus saharensis]
MTATMSESVSAGTEQVERKPLMSGSAILMMNLGFFGVQFSFGLTQSAVNPLFLLIGATPQQLPILNLAGPVTGLVIQPLIGAISDRTWSPRWGRRRPFVIGGAILCAIILAAFPFVGVLWLAVICFWLLDAGNNTSMEPYRALISDRLPKSQLARGFLTQSMFTGAGAVLANLSLFILQKVSALQETAGNGVPYWMYVCFLIGTFCILLTVLTAMARTKELTPSDEELAEIRSAPKGLHHAVREIADAVRVMPVAMHKIGVVFLFQWYAMFIYWQFLAVSLGETVFGATPEEGGRAWDDAIAWSGLQNAGYNFVTMVSALFLVGFARRIGAKRVHAVALGLAAASLIWLAQIDNQYVALIPMIGLGVFWASAVGIPYLMVASMVPANRTGVYMGILNMMIVVPMLIQTVTFGWIFTNLLGGSGANAIRLAGILLAIGAVAMLWVNPPDEADESPIVPLGSKRSITVYDRVVVGSDGTPTSLYAVDRAAEVAQAAQARLVVVTAYRDGTPDAASTPGGKVHRDIHGADAAREALGRSVTGLTRERARFIEQRLVAGDPAQALLDTVGNNPANLIVVGNRGLGASEGQMLGSVPAGVVRNAVCDVLVVQTSALDEERLFASAPEAAADRAGPVAGGDAAGPRPGR